MGASIFLDEGREALPLGFRRSSDPQRALKSNLVL
jgi:hypothetical protein